MRRTSAGCATTSSSSAPSEGILATTGTTSSTSTACSTRRATPGDSSDGSAPVDQEQQRQSPGAPWQPAVCATTVAITRTAVATRRHRSLNEASRRYKARRSAGRGYRVSLPRAQTRIRRGRRRRPLGSARRGPGGRREQDRLSGAGSGGGLARAICPAKAFTAALAKASRSGRTAPQGRAVASTCSRERFNDARVASAVSRRHGSLVQHLVNASHRFGAVTSELGAGCVRPPRARPSGSPSTPQSSRENLT